MAIVRMDTTDLSKYIDEYTVGGEFLRFGPIFRNRLSQDSLEELDRLENYENVVRVREELAKFDRSFNQFTTLEDVENIDKKLRGDLYHGYLMFSLHYPVKEFAKELLELFQIKILYYVITITNRDLPESEIQSHVVMSKPNNDFAQNRIHICLDHALNFIKHWSVNLEIDHYPRKLYNNYRNQITLMAKEAGIDIRTDEEKRKDGITKAKDKTVEILLTILMIFIVALILSLLFN